MQLLKAFVILLMACSIWVNGKQRERLHHGKKQINNLQFIQQQSDSTLQTEEISAKKGAHWTSSEQPGKRDNTVLKRTPKNDPNDATDALVKEIKDINLNEFAGKKMGKAQKGWSTSLGAAESLYDKIKQKDKMGIAISTITMASGLAAMTGGPVGFLVAIALDTVKTILTLIDKHQKGPPESESSKLQKAIEKSLRKFTETELSADWNGYKRLTEVFLKHLDMIESFDEIKPLTGKDEEKFNIEDMGGKEEVKQQLFDEVSPQIYKVLTASTHLLGKIEHHISKVCDFDIQARKVKERKKIENWRIVTFEKEPIPKEDEIEEKDSFATSCLKLYELYAKITTYHYQTYLKGLEVIQKIVGEKYYDALSELPPTDPKKEKKKEAKEEKSRRKAYVFMQLLLDMIQNSREYNKKVFKPFLNPYEHYKMRYTVNYYHNNAKMYEHLNTYLKEFYVDEDIQKKVMFCSQQSLLGSCYLEDGTKAQQPGPWRSAYVPKGKSITVQYQVKKGQDVTFDENDGLPIQMIGPSSMGMLFTLKMKYRTNTLGAKDHKERISQFQKFDQYVKQITVADDKEPPKDAQGKPGPSKKLFKMCVTRDYLQDNPRHHASVCITDEFKGVVKTITLNRVKSPTEWRGKNISLSCSEPDLAFVGTHHWNEQNKQFRWGPFFSPFPMMQLPGSVRWDTITVYPYKDEDDSKVKAIAKDDKICEGNNNLLCQGETIDKKIFITICKKAELKGYCEEIPVLKSEITGNNKEKQVSLTVINGDGKYFQLNQEKKLKNQQVAIGTQDSPDPTSMTHTHLYDSYYDVDNSVWQPLIKDGKAYNLLQSMKVPDDILVELYTKDASGKRDRKFGAYEGPLTVDRIDGNDVMSNLIHFIVIKYSPKKIAAEDTTAGGDQADVDPKAENHTMPNDAEPLVTLPEGPDNGGSTTVPNSGVGSTTDASHLHGAFKQN